MAAPGRRNVTCTAGDDYEHTITFVDANGAAQNVSTWTFAAKVSATYSSTGVAFAVDSTAAASGVITISLTDTQTAALEARNVWDLQRTVGSNTLTVLAGVFTVKNQVA